MGKNIIYEDVLQYVGEFGVYQLCIYIYACGIAFISVESIYMNFIGYRMDHWCAVPELVDLPYDVQKNVAIPYASNSTDDYEQCEMFSMNYSLYSDDQFLNWNRQNGYETEECSGWVYDQSVYAENIINEVRNRMAVAEILHCFKRDDSYRLTVNKSLIIMKCTMFGHILIIVLKI